MSSARSFADGAGAAIPISSAHKVKQADFKKKEFKIETMFSLKYSSYTLKWLARIAAAKMRGRVVVIAGKCNMCGACCAKLNLAVGKGWVRSEKEFERMKKKYPEYEYFEITGRAPGGELDFRCRMIDGNGLCSIHDSKPKLCAEYPSLDGFFMGSELIRGCGYRIESAPSFGRVLKKAVKERDRGGGGES